MNLRQEVQRERILQEISRRAGLRDQALLKMKIEEKDAKDEAWQEYNENLGKEQFFAPSINEE